MTNHHSAQAPSLPSSSNDGAIPPAASTPSAPENVTYHADNNNATRTPNAAQSASPPSRGITSSWSDRSESSSSARFPPGTTTTTTSVNNDSSIRTVVAGTRRRRQQQQPYMLSACQRRFRALMRFIIFPVMVLTTLVALLLFFMFIGLPFFLFLAGLLMVYYCCTSDPIPFRTLIRAMVGVEDWNGGAFDGTTSGEPYNVTKEDIRKGIIRRLCLGPMEWKAAVPSVVEDTTVGGDLEALPRDHPGRVHWRNEASSVTCLVFSEPLGSSSASSASSSSSPAVKPPLAQAETDPEVSSPDLTLEEEMLRREELGRGKIPKYLQQHKEEEVKVEEEGEETTPDDKEGLGNEIIECNEGCVSESVEIPVKPISDAEEPSQSTIQNPLPDDDTSVRDRGTVCDICLLEFETGEAVAWSPNPACNHAYHEECITDWLLRKPTCPNCRQNFILLPSVRQSVASSSGSTNSEMLVDDDDDDVESGSRENSNGSRSSDMNNWNGPQAPTTEAVGGDIETATSETATN